MMRRFMGKLQLHPVTHAQFISKAETKFKKGASDRNSPTGLDGAAGRAQKPSIEIEIAMCARANNELTRRHENSMHNQVTGSFRQAREQVEHVHAARYH